MAAGRDGSLKEMWGTGTAAVVSPVGTLGYKGEDVLINGGEIGDVTRRLYDAITIGQGQGLTGIRQRLADGHHTVAQRLAAEIGGSGHQPARAGAAAGRGGLGVQARGVRC